MKKSSIIALALFASLAFTACSNSAEALVSQYEKACEAGKTEKAMKIAEKIEKLDKDELTEEQAIRIYKASLLLTDF